MTDFLFIVSKDTPNYAYMTKNRKLSSKDRDYLASMPDYTTKRDQSTYKPLKYALLRSMEDLFDDLGMNLSKPMYRILEEIAFRSTEKGFEFVSPDTLSEKFGVSSKTIYRNLKILIDEKVLFKKNFSSKNHNGLGAGVYFLYAHPYFAHFNTYFGECWTDEKADEKADEKPEVAEIPTPTRSSGDSETPTLSLPSLDLKEKDIDLHINVQESSSQSKRFIECVPKEINAYTVYVNAFDFRLRYIWRKITQAWKTIRLPHLDRDHLIEVGARVIKRIYQIWKQKIHNHSEMTVDEMCAFAYKATRDTIYGSLATEHMEDYDAEENSLMGEAVQMIPKYEEICMRVYPEYDYEAIKEYVAGCLEWGFRWLQPESLHRILDHYDMYTTMRIPSRMALCS